MSDHHKTHYSLGEDITSSIIHGVGALFAVAGLSVFVTLAALQGDAWRVVSFSIYGATLFMMFLASTLYHSFRSPRVKRVFRTLDHVAIYLLIAGTYTPFTLVSLRGPWGWSIFGTIWGLALAGIVLKSFLTGRFAILSSAVYIGMGWIVVIALKPTLSCVPAPGVMWLAIGGVLYTFGVVFYAGKKVPYNHAIWHVFVLAAAVCHFLAIVMYVLPVA